MNLSLWIFIGVIVIILVASVKKSPISKTESKFNHIARVSTIDCEGIPQGIEGLLTMDNENLTFKSDNYNKIIPTQSLLSISCANTDQIINSNAFSVGRAVVGGALFGTIGGAIGGFSGNKNFIPKAMVVHYNENEVDKTILFMQYMKSNDKTNTLIDRGKYLEDICVKMNNELKTSNIS